MLKKILLAVAVLLVLFLGVVALQPADYSVVRSASIAAPAADIFAQVNDFHNWDAWSPWTKLDPAMKKGFEGPPSGLGSVFTWSGNDKAGEGRMILTESKPNEMVRTRLKFVKPSQSVADTEFVFKPEGNSTQVTWTMTGRKNFLEKAVCLFMDLDKLVGGDFEKGLAQLKSVVEAGAKK